MKSGLQIRGRFTHYLSSEKMTILVIFVFSSIGRTFLICIIISFSPTGLVHTYKRRHTQMVELHRESSERVINLIGVIKSVMGSSGPAKCR